MPLNTKKSTKSYQRVSYITPEQCPQFREAETIETTIAHKHLKTTASDN